MARLRSVRIVSYPYAELTRLARIETKCPSKYGDEEVVQHILLTGAGFSRNWGGWLVSEAFEYLLGCSEIDDETRRLLWVSRDEGGGFEDTLALLANPSRNALAELATGEEAGSGERRLNDLTTAIVGMFNAMGRGYMQRQFEFQNDVRYMVKTFLSRFDAIFTLNQDTLLELHYLDRAVGGKWNGFRIPGIKPLNQNIGGLTPLGGRQGNQQPDQNDLRFHPGIQPYVKLHGSANWSDGTSGGRILIMGGHKADSIQRFPLLRWYHDAFNRALVQPNARLMIIGYSFGDPHINNAISEGAKAGLKLFIVDPLGVGLLDRRSTASGPPRRDDVGETLARGIIGASRRPLTSTFADDVVEHERLTAFFS